MTNVRQHLHHIITGLLIVLIAASAAPIAIAQTRDQDHEHGRDHDRPTPPPVPDTIRVPPDVEPFLVGHATGTQNYVCLPSASGVAFSLFTPEATLFDHEMRQLTTHFFSPNPAENGTIRATWEDSRDTSRVWGKAAQQSSDPAFVKAGAIPWVLLQITGVANGPRGGDALSKTVFIQRLNTDGGAAPTTGCAAPADIGNKAFVPYTADYFFFKKTREKD
jgi:hypothetical protein